MKRRDDDGYSLLVVVGFVLLLVSAILYTGFQIENDTINGQSLAATSARHDALTAVAVAAIQSLRYDPLIGSGQTLNSPSYCFGAGPTSTASVNTFTATAYCATTLSTGTTTSTRQVTLVACASGDVTSCEAAPELKVNITYTDNQVDTSANTTNCEAVCGQVETIGAWKW